MAMAATGWLVSHLLPHGSTHGWWREAVDTVGHSGVLWWRGQWTQSYTLHSVVCEGDSGQCYTVVGGREAVDIVLHSGVKKTVDTELHTTQCSV